MVKSLIVLKKSGTDALKTAGKRAIQKTAEATGDLVGNKIADKFTSISKNQQKSSKMMNCNQIKQIINTKRKIHISTRKTINY